MATSKKRRNQRIVISNEAKVFRELRLAKKWSMRKAGQALGVSDTYISHIENGRADVPTGERLEHFLIVLEGPRPKSFYERARAFKAKITDRGELLEIIQHISDERIPMLLGIVKGVFG